MARRRVDNGKRIDTHEVRTADGRDIKIDVYMVKGSSLRGGTQFRAICDEIDLDETGEDVDTVTKLARKIAMERSDVKWEPHLHVTVKGVRHLPPKEASEEDEDGEGEDDDVEDPDEAALPELFGKGNGRGYQGRQQVTFKLEIEVDRYELATIAGKKVHRYPADKGERAPQVHNDWPRTGRSLVHTYGYYRNEPKPLGDMNALVRDTPEMREALSKIRSALADMTMRLDDLLSPGNVEATLERVLAGVGALPALSERSSAEPKEPPVVSGEVIVGKIRRRK